MVCGKGYTTSAQRTGCRGQLFKCGIPKQTPVCSCAAVQLCSCASLWVDLLGDLWGEEEKQTGVRVCVQVAQLELEAQRVQLEQEDAAHSGTSSEAMQRLQQQVCLSCLHSVSIWTWGLPAAALSALKYRLQISPFAVNCHGHGNSPFAFLRIICMRETLCICK